MREPKRILVISPYSGDIEKNLKYLDCCMRYVIAKGHAPFAPHFIYPHFLDDSKPEERRRGLEMGLVWGEKAEEIWIFVDHGHSEGMSYERAYYQVCFTDIPIRDILLDNPKDSNDA